MKIEIELDEKELNYIVDVLQEKQRHEKYAEKCNILSKVSYILLSECEDQKEREKEGL